MSSEMMFSYVFPNALHGNVPLVSITLRVVIGQSSLHRLAILRVGVLLPGIFLMVNVGLGKIYGFRLGSPSCVVSAGRDMTGGSYD